MSIKTQIMLSKFNNIRKLIVHILIAPLFPNVLFFLVNATFMWLVGDLDLDFVFQLFKVLFFAHVGVTLIWLSMFLLIRSQNFKYGTRELIVSGTVFGAVNSLTSGSFVLAVVLMFLFGFYGFLASIYFSALQKNA